MATHFLSSGICPRIEITVLLFIRCLTLQGSKSREHRDFIPVSPPPPRVSGT